MELQDLKTLWQDYTAEHLSRQELAPQELRQLLKGKTQNVVSSLKRKILLECSLMVLVGLLFIVSSFLLPGPGRHLHALLTLILLIFTVSTIFFVYKYREISRISLNADNLKDDLNGLIRTLRQFLKMYLYGNTVFTPISFFAGFCYGYQASREPGEPITAWAITVGLALTAVICLVVYPFLKWLTQRVYGGYLNKLYEYQEELMTID